MLGESGFMGSKSKKIDIVMATYNGEKYISEQLDSIVNSEDFNNHIKNIIIVDDCSTDNTINIISTYCAKYKNIIFTPCGERKLGAAKNFEKGILLSSAPYVMLCDQDDIWLPNKISKSFEKIVELERREGNVPSLVFSDVSVVNSGLDVIYDSFLDLNKINNMPSIEFLCFNNIAPGCTMILNRTLIGIAFPMPENVIMHDWWLLLYALFCGKIDILYEQTMLYRQHGNNTVGVKRNSLIRKIIYINKQWCDFVKNRERCIGQLELLFFSKNFKCNEKYVHIWNLFLLKPKVSSVFNMKYWVDQFRTEMTVFRRLFLILYCLMTVVKK